MAEKADEQMQKPRFYNQINLGNVLSMITIAGVAIAGWLTFNVEVEKRFTKVEQQVQYAQTSIVGLDKQMDRANAENEEARRRLWESVNSSRNSIDALSGRINRLEVGQDYMIKQLDRLVDEVVTNRNRTMMWRAPQPGTTIP